MTGMRAGGATVMQAEAGRRSRCVEWHMGEATWIWREREIGDQALEHIILDCQKSVHSLLHGRREGDFLCLGQLPTRCSP